jgi:hypothetical protein
MTITSDVTSIQVPGNGSATVFAAPMKIFAATDIVVGFVISDAYVQQTSGYNVTNIDINGGCTITFQTPPPSSVIVDIRTNTPATQGTEFANLGAYLPNSTTDACDRIVRIVQDLARKTYDFGIHGPDTEGAPWPVLPDADTRAGMALLFDSNGNPTIGIPVSGTITGQIIAALLNSNQVGGILWPQTNAELTASITPSAFAYLPGQSSRNSVDPTGVTDCTATLQTWVNEAWSMFSFVDGQSLWSGGGAAAPVITLAPGKYKISGPTVLPTGCTVTGSAHPANTTSHTRLVMNSTATSPPSGAGDNRNDPIFKFSRANALGGVVMVNQYLNMTVQNLEFWYVTGSNDFNLPLGGSGINFGDYPDGGSLFFDVDVVDTRIVSCCFQNTPCAIRIKNVSGSSTRGDGLPAAGTPAVNMFIEECEFDAAAAHVYATNSVLDLTFRNCAFYGGRHKYVGCTGRVVYENCRFYGGAYIDATDTVNNFTLFRVSGGTFDQVNGVDTISVYKAVMLEVKSVTFGGATGNSTIVANFCSSGSIGNNSINDSGFGAPSTTGTGASAAVKLIDCQNMAVQGNNVTATDSASYNGFGILTLSSARTSQNNFIDGNAITAPYTGAQVNSLNRQINYVLTDVIGVNYSPNSWAASKSGTQALTRTDVAQAATITLNALAGNEFDITVSTASAIAMAAPTNPSDGQLICVAFKNTSGGAMGTVTWNAVFKTGTFTAPATGANRTLMFKYNGTNWIQVFAGTLDIPN